MTINSEIEIEELRPETFEEFIGQARLKEVLINYIDFHKKNNKIMDHILLTGPAGLGKSTIAKIIGHVNGAHVFDVTGPNLRKIEDVITIMGNIRRGDIMFIDEIHRINKNVEHFLYTIMTDFHFSATIKVAGDWRVLEASIPKFTVVGATTQPGLLTKPFLQRFGFRERIDYYSLEELIEIIYRSSRILGITIWREGAYEIAKRARFTPRIANRILKRVREYASKIQEGEIIGSTVKEASKQLDIDELGLEKIDRDYLKYLADQKGGPCGIGNIASAIEEDIDTISQLHEPYMIRMGLIRKTAKGRILLEAGFKHLGLEMKEVVKDKKGDEVGGRYRYDDSEITVMPTKSNLPKRI